jgi:mannose-6-phosphate isomerase class I
LSGARENSIWRETSQDLLPVNKLPGEHGTYNIYPSFKIADNLIFAGYEILAETVHNYRHVMVEGYGGVFFDIFTRSLAHILNKQGYSVRITDTSASLKSPAQITELTAPFLGGDDPLFGTRTTLDIEDFFVPGVLESIVPDSNADINIIAGPGASLAGWPGLLIYIDLPKNEVQYRARAGSIANLGMCAPADPGMMYKRFYFVDWIVLNNYKKKILPSVNLFVDGQRPEVPLWINAEALKETFSHMCHSPFRARPWFEPGTWGGSWIRQNIRGLNKNVPNYAWSFELITPENGLIIESSSMMLEVSFDTLMYFEAESILGDCYSRFSTYFPIRFDFLDTFDGGNLSLQCHPRPEYIKDNFGEPFTQEETYYILDNKDGAVVFLGFIDDIDPDEFRHVLEKSFLENKEIDPEKFILKHPSRKHDLFLIPYGTIHGSGKNNLVLEISSTPYIFTFKMYDWLRPDLNGKSRTLNIGRGMENLFFDKRGNDVAGKLISRPELIAEGPGWKQFHLRTHETHLYDIHRYHIKDEIEIETDNKCLVMSLVEGKSIMVESLNRHREQFSFAETFIIPAAAGKIRIFNKSDGEAILVKAFVK